MNYAGGMYGISGRMGFISSGLMLVTLRGDRSVAMLIGDGRLNLPSGFTTGLLARWCRLCGAGYLNSGTLAMNFSFVLD